ncbi:hypothetical protein ACKGJO_00945 [Gracilimonas sp. Q87]|uniref:hypothetical protein n=1 Tax=Gracilimonas sp. Q87 TaxID=3384766 RepID=UPI0039840E68
MTEDVKRRLMFIKGEDYYFITYNIIILLKELNCISDKNRYFQDVRKLSFLIEFVSDESLTILLEKYEGKNDLNQVDKSRLNRAYSNGLLRLEGLNRLLFSLEKNGLIKLRQNKSRTALDITLSNSPKLKWFFNEEAFELEKENADKLRSEIKYLTRLKLENVLVNVFNNYGVSTWQV